MWAPKNSVLPLAGRVVSAATYSLKPTFVSHPLTKLNAPGESATSTVALREAIFSRSPIRADLIHRVVVWQLAKRRQGTAKGKNRVSASATPSVWCATDARPSPAPSLK